MGWLEKFRKPKKQEQRNIRVVTPFCSVCEKEIESLNVSIGEVIEEQGAFLYSGSEGTLYEPLYAGSICLSCGMKICDDCLDEAIDRSRCPTCGGSLRVLTPKRLPKAD